MEVLAEYVLVHAQLLLHFQKHDMIVLTFTSGLPDSRPDLIRLIYPFYLALSRSNKWDMELFQILVPFLC